mgnify:FL=1
MPPKIREMTVNLNSDPNGIKRFTLMVSGEDALDIEDGQSLSSPPRGLPHERFLLGEAVPIAPVLLMGQSHQTINPQQYIACLQPVHLHATRDHLVLMAQDQVDLTSEESVLLFNAIQPMLEEDFQSKVLFQGQRYWFISAGPFMGLRTHSLDQAHGRNIDWWMPRDSDELGIAKRWRKLQNEIQMLWHIDPVNETREERGLPTINSLWISGIGKLADLQIPEVIQNANCLCGNHPLLAGLAQFLNIPHFQTIQAQDLSRTFAWPDNPAEIWPLLCQALLEKCLEEVLIIDFPAGKKRERVFTSKTISKSSWLFWKKSEVLSWQQITQE